jgi:hypothetical protein
VCWTEVKIAIGRRSRCSLGHNRDVLLVVMAKHSTILEVYAIAARRRNHYTYTYDTSSNRTQVQNTEPPFSPFPSGKQMRSPPLGMYTMMQDTSSPSRPTNQGEITETQRLGSTPSVSMWTKSSLYLAT